MPSFRIRLCNGSRICRLQAGLKAAYEAHSAVPRLPVRGRHHRVRGGRRRDRRPAVAFLQGPAGLFAAAGLRAAGDDPRARGRRLTGRRIRPRAAALYSDPGGAEAGDQRASSRPRTRTSTSTAGSISTGIARAGLNYVQNYGSGRRPQGASTITQQVAKNFLLTNEVSLARKIKEALLALKIERTYSQGQDPRALPERDLSRPWRLWHRRRLARLFRQIGQRTDRSRKSPISRRCRRRPNNYHPFRQRERALERRNWVIDRMAEAGFIKTADADKAKRTPLGVTTKATERACLRRRLFRRGSPPRALTIATARRSSTKAGSPSAPRSTPNISRLARQSLTDGLVKFDEGQGWRGPVSKIDISRRLGRQACRREGARRRGAVAARRRAGCRPTSRPVSACSPDASPAATSARSGRPASCRWTA